jgi:16S rRNA (uracil1498-N3)-methyltransferase
VTGPAAPPPTRGHHVVLGRLDGPGRLRVDGPAGHHLGAVLRVRVGEPVSLTDGRGALAQAVVTAVGRDVVDVEVDDPVRRPAPRPAVTVLQALPKGRKLDDVVQRLAEVGVDRLVPVVTARTVKRVDGGAKEARLRDRWQAVARAAAEQSRRAHLLAVDEVASWAEATAGEVRGLVLHERATTPLGRAAAALAAGADEHDELLVAVGPEGGFEDREVEASGLVPVRLGATILRTETAGVVGAALLLHHLGRLG